MSTPEETGRRMEEAAAEYLKRKGFRILERRYRSRYGEIDLIAEDGPVLVFVEVKYRSSLAQGRPVQYVNAAKQRKICTTALQYLRQSRRIDAACRFDIIELWLEQGKMKVHHYQNAFEGAG